MPAIVRAEVANLKQISKDFAKMPKIAEQSMRAAAKRTEAFANKVIWESIKEIYAVKKADVNTAKGAMEHKRKNGGVVIEMRYSGHVLSLAHFRYTPKAAISKGKRRKVRATIKKGQAKATGSNTFVATTGTKSASKTQFNVFKRKGQSRLPISVFKTVSVPQMVSNAAEENDAMSQIGEKFAERLEHEWKRRTAGKL